MEQTYQDFEWVIADDGSTDGTQKLLEEFAGLDPRVKLVKLDHKKEMFWNPGKFASGSLIITMDTDDYLIPTALEEIIHYFNIFPNTLAMTFIGMKYSERLPRYDDQTAGVLDRFVEVPYMSKVDSYLEGMDNLGPKAPHIFGTCISWRNIPIEFPEHKDTPYASGNDSQWLLVLEEHGLCMNVPRVLKLVRQRGGSENFSNWSRQGECILINEAKARRKEIPLPMPRHNHYFEDVKTAAEALYVSSFNYQTKASVNFVGFEYDSTRQAKLKALYPLSSITFGQTPTDYTVVNVPTGTYALDFIKLFEDSTGKHETVFHIYNRNMAFDRDPIIHYAKSKGCKVVETERDNKITIIHNLKSLTEPKKVEPIIIDTKDGMLRNVLELYNSVEINPGRVLVTKPTVSYHFIDGPFLEVKGGPAGHLYHMTFRADGQTLYENTLESEHWARASIKFAKPWELSITSPHSDFHFHHQYDPTGKRVFIAFESKALGDTLAWIPQVDLFQKKFNADVTVSTHWNKLFDYPNLKFVEPGSTVHNLYALFRIGCYDQEKSNDDSRLGYMDIYRNKNNWRAVPLQQVAADTLGLDYDGNIRPRIADYTYNRDQRRALTPNAYITVAETAGPTRAKHWNNLSGWPNLVKALKKRGHTIVSLNQSKSKIPGVISRYNLDITEVVKILRGSSLHIGLGSGLSWLSWALNIPTAIISGFSDVTAEPEVECRVILESSCHGCYSEVQIPFSKAVEWCPRGKDYECTRLITSDYVLQQLEEFLP